MQHMSFYLIYSFKKNIKRAKDSNVQYSKTNLLCASSVKKKKKENYKQYFTICTVGVVWVSVRMSYKICGI